ncbi:hypothetical protein GCM10009821_13440 [Aeromicrobium halocynthiae]|uniref:Secreted protein n=1 Tax=Aeromicrobium halocynthiae TaxID=560557 RepID=A0ABN2VX29_9ACTN
MPGIEAGPAVRVSRAASSAAAAAAAAASSSVTARNRGPLERADRPRPPAGRSVAAPADVARPGPVDGPADGCSFAACVFPACVFPAPPVG